MILLVYLVSVVKKVFVNARFLTQSMSGVQHFALTLSLTLKEKRPDISFITCRDVLHDKSAIELGALRTGKLTGQAWEQIELPAFLKKRGSPLLINLCNTAPLSYSNQFNTIHDLAFEQNQSWFNPRFKYYYRWLMPRIAKNCRQLFTVSAFSASEILEHYTLQSYPVGIISNAVSKEMEDLIAGIDSSPMAEPYFLTVGTMDPRKNLKGILAAFTEGNFSRTKLVVIGRRNSIFNHSGFDPQLTRHPQIEWKEDIDNRELTRYYKHALAFLNLSYYEGFGLNNLEAMACGCPLILSDIPVFHEVCKDAGSYFHPDQAKDVAGRMQEIIQNPGLRMQMKKAGQERASWYSRERQVSSILKALSDAGY